MHMRRFKLFLHEECNEGKMKLLRTSKWVINDMNDFCERGRIMLDMHRIILGSESLVGRRKERQEKANNAEHSK